MHNCAVLPYKSGAENIEFTWRGFGATDAPDSDGDWFFHAYRGDSNWIRIVAFDIRHTASYEIAKAGGRWGKWEKLADSGNAHTLNGRHSGRIATKDQNGEYYDDSAENINDAYLQWNGSHFILKTIGGNLTMADNADTVDGKHADDFALKSELKALENRITSLEKKTASIT